MARMLAAALMAFVAFPQVQAVPLGEVVITHAGSFKDEYLYATRYDDSHGSRFVHTWTKGSLQADPQARWNISKVGGSYVITRARPAGTRREYFYTSQHDDTRGGHYVHTWTRGALQEDPSARWNISEFSGNYVITHAGSLKDEYLCATQQKQHGWRFVHMMESGVAAAAMCQWKITPVAKEKAGSKADRPHVRPHGRPHGARARAHQRALTAMAAEEVASTGCVNLGGDKWFSDAHGRLFQVSQDRCWITFSLPAKNGEMYGKRGVVKGYKVHVEPPFPDGQILPNQTVMFDNGAHWELKWP
jgi:hypothetical protein